MRRWPLLAAICLATCLTASGAAAEGRKRPIPMTVRAGAEALHGQVGDFGITKADAFAGVRLDAVHRLTLYADLMFGAMDVSFSARPARGLTADGRITEYLDLSARTGAAITLYERWRVGELRVFAEYESSVVGLEPEMSRLRLGLAEGTYDVSPYAADHVAPEIFWNRFSAGLSYSIRLGRFTPVLAIAYQVFDAELDLRFTEQGRDTVRRLGFDDGALERRHGISFWSVPIMPSLEYGLTRKSGIVLEGLIMPVRDSVMFGGGLHYRHDL